MFQRPHFLSLQQRILQNRSFIQVLMGPRQVGKTTLVRQFLDQYNLPWHYASADEATHPAWLQQQWETIRLKQRSTGAAEALLVIDEIQKIADWSNQVKAQWDKDTFELLPVKILLLGSSQLLLQKGLSESLAGRFEIIRLPHWSFQEMEDAFGFSMEEYIWFGGYPGPAPLIHDETRWKDYIRQSLIETTIMRDILLLTRIDKPSLLRNLFDLGCLWSGQVLSFTKILGQLDGAGNTTTLAHYLKLLEGAGMIRGLEKYSPSMIRRRSSSPKFQVLNMALMSATSSRTRNETEALPDFYGRWVESAVGSHLANLASGDPSMVCYWREGNHEVDFVLNTGNKAIGIEVKSGRNKPASGLPEFSKRFRPDRTYLVGPDGIPVRDFLRLTLTDLIR